jgi:hypothetical protein
MMKRYKRPKGVLLMPQDDGEFVLSADHDAEMREVLESAHKMMNFISTWEDCLSGVQMGEDDFNLWSGINEFKPILDKNRAYLDKGE